MKLPSAIQHIAVTRIHSPSFQQQLRLSERIFNRKRPLSFATVIGSILQKISRSLPIEAGLLGDILKQRPVSKQALSNARYKIGVSAFQELSEETLALHYTDNPLRLWKGFCVFGGDGSTLQPPRSGDIPQFFGDHFKRTCLARVKQFTESASDIVVTADLMPYRTSEEEMAKTLLPKVVNI